MFLRPVLGLAARIGPVLPAALAASVLAAAPVGAQGQAPNVAALIEALDMPAIIAVMREEGLDYGDELAAEMFSGPGSAEWNSAVSETYATERLSAIFEQRFAAELAGADVPAMLAFATSDLGRRVTVLEVSARRAMLDQAVDDAARLGLEEAMAASDPRVALVKEFVAAGDLIEANVAGGLNANLAFYRGLASVAGGSYNLSEQEMLADVWGQEGSIRDSIEDWLLSFLFLAYKPISDAELRACTAFWQSPEGRAMNYAMFAAFDAMFSDVSYRLGRAAAQEISGQEL